MCRCLVKNEVILLQLHEIFRSSSNPIVMAGDSHNAWAYNVLDPNTSVPLAVEFDDPSVTPPGLDSLTQILPGKLKLVQPWGQKDRCSSEACSKRLSNFALKVSTCS